MDQPLPRIDGFTLIELLVVVTIIVVLLGLLAPALDKAIYAAELAICGTHQNAIATGAITYAAGNRRYYPNPPGGRVTSYSPDQIGIGSYPQYDLREAIKDHISLKALLCPLTAPIPLDKDQNLPNTGVYANYNIWFAYGFETNGVEPGMFRQGDRFQHYDSTTMETHSFRLLASDENIVDPNQPQAQSSHPDYDGIMADQTLHDQNGFGVPGSAVDTTLTNGTNGTVSRWGVFGGQRSLIDLNVVYDDGSVQRFTAVQPIDPRMVRVPASRHRDIAPGIYIPLN